MDSTAASMCRDNNMPILVFGLSDPENSVRAVKGEKIGTLDVYKRQVINIPSYLLFQFSK